MDFTRFGDQEYIHKWQIEIKEMRIWNLKKTNKYVTFQSDSRNSNKLYKSTEHQNNQEIEVKLPFFKHTKKR